MIQGKDMLFSYVISVIENRDFYAEYHCEKVQRFTRILLEKVIRFCPDYKISEEDVDTICFAAMLHDVGKTVIPDRILHKAGRLDFNELEIMKNHTRKGRQIFTVVPRLILTLFQKSRLKLSLQKYLWKRLSILPGMCFIQDI